MPVMRCTTKGNLSKIKRSLALAKMGYELMDRKRNILIREMMSAHRQRQADPGGDRYHLYPRPIPLCRRPISSWAPASDIALATAGGQ